MMKKINLYYKRKKFSLEVKKLNDFQKAGGLMFLSREKAKALLFDFKKTCNLAFTSLFVFFDFYVVWMNSKNQVLDIKRIKPFRFTIKAPKNFTKLIEIPVNKKYSKFLKSLDEN